MRGQDILRVRFNTRFVMLLFLNNGKCLIIPIYFFGIDLDYFVRVNNETLCNYINLLL